LAPILPKPTIPNCIELLLFVFDLCLLGRLLELAIAANQVVRRGIML
jgi:hypothetical protein